MNNQPSDSFKNAQKKFDRVSQAFREKGSALHTLITQMGINDGHFSLILAAFKYEKELQVYIRGKNQKKYKLLKTFDFCVLSGTLGPKRKEGDRQVPEGLYEICAFNPCSRFHLSLRINYPNAADRILSDQTWPGSDIYLHGGCVSTGCIPLTDEGIKELYLLCVQAFDHYPYIPVYIFPFHMTDENMHLFNRMDWGMPVENLWRELKPVYDEFTQTKDVIRFGTDERGRYQLTQVL